MERCLKLAKLYGTSMDALMKFEGRIGNTELTPGPKGKHIFGTVKINDRGQVVILKEARELFHLKPGDSIVVLGDEAEGIALVKAELFEEKLNQMMNKCKMPV